MAMVAPAGPRVRRGDVSAEPRRRLLIAVVVAALLLTAYGHFFDCAPTDDRRCRCRTRDAMLCSLEGDKVPLFRPSHTYDMVKIYSWSHTLHVTIPTEAFKNLNAKRIEIVSFGDLTVEPGALSGLGGQLEELTIRYELQTISDGLFDGISQLRSLILNRNPLKTLGRRIFSQLAHLEKLYLTHIQLKTINDEAFGGLNQLKYTDTESAAP